MLSKCNLCDGRFAKYFFSDSSARRLCVLQREHDELKKKIHVLQEFVTANLGILPPTDQSTNHTAIAATKKDIVSLLKRVLQGEVPFIPVGNGARRTNNKSFLSITTYNNFKILTEEEEENHETRIIGDSIVREQLSGRA